MSNEDHISTQRIEAIKPSAAYFFNQTSGIIDINNGHNQPSLLGAKDFVSVAYVALKEQGMDLRFNDDLHQIADVMVQAYIGNLLPEQQAYVLQNQDAYKNAIVDALNDFDRLEFVKSKNSLNSGLDDLFSFMPPPER